MKIKTKTTLNKKTKDLLGVANLNGKLRMNKRSKLITDVRKDFSKQGPKKSKQAILQDIAKGISPVNKKRFPKYSKSYKDAIKKNRYKKVTTNKKMISPVNLRLSGDLSRSLITTTFGGFARSFRMVFLWNHFLADIHNRRGASKKKVVRRMLPTNSGEKFNRRITSIIFDELKKSVNSVVKRYT